jgi:hypothetical protein
MREDFTNMTTAELMAAEKKVRTERTTGAVFIGFLVGVILYGAVTNGFGLLHTGLPLGLIYVLYRNSKKTNQRIGDIRAELARKQRA